MKGHVTIGFCGAMFGVIVTTGIAFASTISDVVPGAANAPPALPRAPTTGYVSGGYRSLHFHSSLGGFNFPFQLTTQGDYLLVSDTLDNVVKLYQLTAGGLTYLRSFGSGSGSGAGQFNGPEQAAIVGNDVYVVDYSNNRVQRFDFTTGAYISQFGAGGSGAGQFSSPSGLVYNPINGLLYVSDVGNDRIQAFSAPGIYQFQFGSSGSGNGQLNNPYVLSVDSAGNILAADSFNNRGVKFDRNGTWLRNVAVGIASPLGVTVDAANMTWLTQSTGDSYAYDTIGSYNSYYYGSLALPWFEGYFHNPRGIATTGSLTFPPFNGRAAVIIADADAKNVQVFTRTLQPTAHPVQTGLSGIAGYIGGVAADSAQNLYVTSLTSNAIYKFDKFGNYLTQWGAAGTGNGQFNGPYGITVDDGDNVYVADNGNSRIQKFTSSGTYVTQWGSAGSGNGQFSSPGSIATDGSWIYVSDEGNDRVQKFGLTGAYVRQWGTSGTGNGQMRAPAGIAVDRERNQVYVAEYFNNRVQQFTVFGDFIKVFADSTSGLGQLSSPVGLSIDQHGNVYVADRGNNRVVQFNDNGTYLANFPSTSASAMLVDNRTAQLYVGASSGGVVSRYGSVAGTNDYLGVYRPGTQTFVLRSSLTPGPPTIVAAVSGAATTDIPVTGDWNGDGVDTPGLYRPSTSTFYLWDRWRDLTIANAAHVFAFGTTNGKPLVGDWDGDGLDSVGVFDPATGHVRLTNALTAAAATYDEIYGAIGDLPVGGDWNQDGAYSAGMFRPSDALFHLTNRNISAVLTDDAAYALGSGRDLPVAGDWTHSGYSGLGVYRPSTGVFTLKFNVDGSPADLTFSFDGDRLFRDNFEGTLSEYPVAGNWGSIPE